MKKSAPREIILSLFNRTSDGYVSGERISLELGISRAAVWKHISSLREAGYQIQAVPSRGYRLVQSPDILLPEAIQSDLDATVIGSRVECFHELDSTNSEACRLADKGAPEGLVVIADQQYAGKGRLGRQWESPAGVNLYASILLRPKILPIDAPKLTFLSAVAVCRAIKSSSTLQPQVKWPNDVLVDGVKVAGLLNEMSSETDQVKYVVLGIGVNLNMQEEQFPSNLRAPASSLAILSGQTVSRLNFTRALLAEIDTLYQLFIAQGSEPIICAWQELCSMIGHPARIDCNGVQIQGVMEGLAEDGALLMRTGEGKIEPVYAGDVYPL